MKKSNPNDFFSFSKIYCFLFGHKYKISKDVTDFVKEYQCIHCACQVTTSSSGSLEPMTPNLKETNSILATIHAKKMARKRQKRIPGQLKTAS